MTTLDTPTAAAGTISRYWRPLAGLALIGWPCLHFLGFLTSPPGETHEPPIFREHATLVQLSAIFLHYGAILIVPVVLGLAYLLHDRMPRLAVIAGLVGAFAAINGSALLLGDFYDLALAESVADEQAVAVSDRAWSYAGVVYGFLLPGFLVHPALIVLTTALAKAGRVGWWQPVLLVTGLVLPFLVASQAPIVQSVGPLLVAAALVPIGVRLLRAPAPR
ncbi:hypothetical protein [Phytohabitans kaempferiae]|uniref:DUF4386 family protein n=1 Tax=Phytohabitans kaempferiae TaxID=1620943 RepID=A0ABV6M370_9ACTN